MSAYNKNGPRMCPGRLAKENQHSTCASLPNFLPPSCFLLAAPTTQITCKHALPLRWRGTLRADLHLFRILEKVLRETLEANQCWAGPLEPGRIHAHKLERLWLGGRRGLRLGRMLPATDGVHRRQHRSEDQNYDRASTHIHLVSKQTIMDDACVRGLPLTSSVCSI
jgi:hypothetical protein